MVWGFWSDINQQPAIFQQSTIKKSLDVCCKKLDWSLGLRFWSTNNQQPITFLFSNNQQQKTTTQLFCPNNDLTNILPPDTTV